MTAPQAIILRNYGCSASQRLARSISERLYTTRYGGLYVDPNEPEDQLDGKDDDGIRRWYKDIRRRFKTIPYAIALLSDELNRTSRSNLKGVGFLSELMLYWERGESTQAITVPEIIPIFIDCVPGQLVGTRGDFDQLPDIIVPTLLKRRPISVTMSLMDSSETYARNFFVEVAKRIGASPAYHTPTPGSEVL